MFWKAYNICEQETDCVQVKAATFSVLHLRETFALESYLMLDTSKTAYVILFNKLSFKQKLILPVSCL